MGADYSAITVIGFRIPVDSVIQTVRARGCDHQEASSRFCPECGSVMWVDKKTSIYDFEESIHFLNLDTIASDIESPKYLFVGKVIRCPEENYNEGVFTDLEDFESLKDTLVNWMGEEHKFGIWTVLYCSY